LKVHDKAIITVELLLWTWSHAIQYDDDYIIVSQDEFSQLFGALYIPQANESDGTC